MPMTEPLQQALDDPNITVEKIANLLKKDGLNCRESITFDTPLIIAARNNNLTVASYLLDVTKKSSDRNNVINATNKKKESPLSAALSHRDKRIALLLIREGVDFSSISGSELTEEAVEWVQAFLDYLKLKDKKLSNDELDKRATSEFEIGDRYLRELNDATEALKWFELSAKDGNKFGMLNVALHYQKNNGDLSQAVALYKRCYGLMADPKNRDLILAQLKSIANPASDDHQSAYMAAMVLGNIYASQGDLSPAFSYFKEAEKLYDEMPYQDEGYILFFKACSFWNGTTADKDMEVMDFLDLTRRFQWLIDANIDEAKAIFVGVAAVQESKITQLIACQLGKDNGFLNATQQSPLTAESNQLCMQALSSLYGWNSQPKNTLRAAGLFKKLADANKDLDQDTTYYSHLMMAFAYFQQEKERDAYVSEAFRSLSEAHACLRSANSPHRNEVIQTLVECVSFVTSAEMASGYLQALMACYAKESTYPNINNMTLIANCLIIMDESLHQDLSTVVETLITCYQKQKNADVRTGIINLLHALKDKVASDPSRGLAIEEALAQCSQASIDESNFAAPQLDNAVDSYKTLADHSDKVSAEVYQKKYLDTLSLRADTSLKQGKYEAALKDYTEVYAASSSTEALIHIAQIETELGYYDEAIAHYRDIAGRMAEYKNMQPFYTMLHGLKKMHDELIERDKRREEISGVVKVMLLGILSSDTSHFTRMDELTELEGFVKLAKSDSEIEAKIQEIRDKILPFEQERAAQAQQQEEQLRLVRKQVEPRGRSSSHQLTILLSLAESEKEHPAALAIVNEAINGWIDNAVQIENEEVLLRNEAGLVQFAQAGYLKAIFYLAKFHQQSQNVQGALSLYARIAISLSPDDNAKKYQQESRQLIEGCATPGGGVGGFLAKHMKYSQYAVDLLDVINQFPNGVEDPDKAIESILRTRKLKDGSNAYNIYLMAMAQTLKLKKDIAANDSDLKQKNIN